MNNICIFEDEQLKNTKEDFKDGYILTISNYNIKIRAKIDLKIKKVRINETDEKNENIEENKKIILYFNNLEDKSKVYT